jgi:adsorption protein B
MVYKLGLIFVSLILLISIDDLIWDIYYFLSRFLGKSKISTIDVNEVEKTIPRMLAVIVAAYNEENVLKSVITNLIVSNQYPKSMYHIF